MKRVEQFIADDGKIFDDEWECEQYERNLKFKSVTINKDFRLWNKNRQLTDDISDAFYIEVLNEEAIEYIIAISEDDGLSTPWFQWDPDKNLEKIPELYGYDEEEDIWFSFAARMRELQETIEALTCSI